MAKNQVLRYLCLSDNPRLQTIKSCICGTPVEIEGLIKKLIHSKKLGEKKRMFWKVV